MNLRISKIIILRNMSYYFNLVQLRSRFKRKNIFFYNIYMPNLKKNRLNRIFYNIICIFAL
jgi:hypothetical protein